MKEAKVVIGANFGDEGKGLMTDYFCSRFPKTERVLNVRFNGGAQAGHTVVTPEGKRHVFSHFGSGSFLPNVATYLGPEFIVNPILFRREYEQLNAMGIWPMVYIHPRCILTVPQDMMVNQFIEKRRGDDRHGSCGVGIYETLLRSKEQTDITMLDTDRETNTYRFNVDIDYYGFNRLEKMTGMALTDDEKALLSNQNIRAHYNQDLKFMMDHSVLLNDDLLNKFDYVVFEGAQGLMLDQNNLEYFPHLTPSNTGIQNVLPYLSGDVDTEVCYVTRPYLTRHGAGNLPEECDRAFVGAKVDLTNRENEWQGALRYGKMDWKEFEKRCKQDIQKAGNLDIKTSVAFTHMDEIGSEKTVAEMLGFEAKNVTGNCDCVYRSDGPTRRNVYKNILGLSLKEIKERQICTMKAKKSQANRKNG